MILISQQQLPTTMLRSFVCRSSVLKASLEGYSIASEVSSLNSPTGIRKTLKRFEVFSLVSTLRKRPHLLSLRCVAIAASTLRFSVIHLSQLLPRVLLMLR